MRKSFVALLLAVVGAASLASLAFAQTDQFGNGDVSGKVMNAQMAKELRSRAARLGTSSAGNDTTYVGFNPAYGASNYWSVGVGNRHPKGTLGAGKPDIIMPPDADMGYWDWERASLTHGDSLQGWWPVRHQYTGTGGLTLPDIQRPWWPIDIGNQISYVINQGPPYRRTFGVTSAWHVDKGLGPVTLAGGNKTGVNPQMPRWTPLAGSKSAWCGLRAHGDDTEIDAVTNNPYTVDALEHVSGAGVGATGTNRKFPGYASQWDQMLYRDIDISGANPSANVSVSFMLRTRMSDSRGTAAATRTGWFDKDPLSQAPNDNNFISSTTAGNANAPIDSFMVYVGCPVADTVGAEWVGSDALTHTVFDPVRRWFGELIRANEPGKYYQLYSTWGNNPPLVVPADSNGVVNVSAIRPDVTYGQLQSTWGNKIRLVFRVKTNRGFDDQDGSVPNQYTSGYLGAAQIDYVNVDLGAGPVDIGDFENESDINNDANTSALVAWKTSSKPPAIYHHVHDLSDLIYQDLCGPPGSHQRICNMAGNVISMGDHDLSEAADGPYGTAEQEAYQGMYSPTINLAFAPTGTNNMGLDANTAVPTEDFYIAYEIYTGYFDLFGLGQGWQFGFQSYPATQSDGTRMWGEFRLPPFQYFNPDKQCFDNLDAAKAWGAIRTSNGGNQPDSIRVLLRKLAQCYRFGITTDCGSTAGGYWDDVALALVDGGAQPPITVDIWEWFNDTFPANETTGLPGLVAFDTTTALIKTGRNDAQTTGDLTRYDVPSDSTLITAEGDSVEVQLVFRISPGPGNYVIPGTYSSGLRKLPTSPTAITSANDNFWSVYINDPGKDSPGFPAGDFKARWSSLVWCSARCDTAEPNIFPVAARNLNNSILSGTFASTYHELDSHLPFLGVPRHKCFLVDTLGPITSITCTSEPAWVTTVPHIRTGYDGNPMTVEGTKIIPDGLLTPGTHVDYFYARKNLNGLPAPGPFLCPDTTTVSPQNSEGPSTDAHRWQEFSVLPDAWKFSRYGGLGQACMLYVDWNDRRGNERVWVSVADSIGATISNKYGAHNGWHAPSKVDINDPSGFVYNLNQQPGTTWDMYGVKASESLNTSSGSLGSRFAYRGTPSLLDDHWAKNSPTISMLEAYYRVLLILTGDLNSAILGPFNDKSSDDDRIIREFLLGSSSSAHRGIMVEGDGFVEAQDGDPLLALLGVSLREASYLRLSGNINPCPDLVTTAAITTNGDLYGVRNTCLFTLDVLDLASADATPATYYDPNGANPLLAPYISGVFKDAVGPNYWQALTDGWNIFNQRSRLCDKTYGRLAYFSNVFTNIFGKICAISGTPVAVNDDPRSLGGKAFVDFAGVNNNILTSKNPEAKISLTLANQDKVDVKIYDVTGRLIRTLADGQLFQAGPKQLTWDGLDNNGRQVARGVYFTQTKFQTRKFEKTQKMIVLK